MANTNNNSTTSRRSTSSQYVKSNQSCGSAFNCGAEYSALQSQVDHLLGRLEQLEHEKEQSKKYVQLATKLINLQRFMLILLPIVELMVIGLVIYFFSHSNIVVYSIISLIGLSTIINGLVLPTQMKNIEERIDKIESQPH